MHWAEHNGGICTLCEGCAPVSGGNGRYYKSYAMGAGTAKPPSPATASPPSPPPPMGPGQYVQIADNNDCCRSNGAKIDSFRGEARPEYCHDICDETEGCRFFSHSKRWDSCILCSECTFSNHRNAKYYTSYSKQAANAPAKYVQELSALRTNPSAPVAELVLLANTSARYEGLEGASEAELGEIDEIDVEIELPSAKDPKADDACELERPTATTIAAAAAGAALTVLFAVAVWAVLRCRGRGEDKQATKNSRGGSWSAGSRAMPPRVSTAVVP